MARGVRRPSEQSVRLREVVGHQPGLGEGASKADFVFVLEPGCFQRLRQDADRVRMAPTLQCRSRSGQRRLKGDGDHGRQYTTARPERSRGVR